MTCLILPALLPNADTIRMLLFSRKSGKHVRLDEKAV